MWFALAITKANWVSLPQSSSSSERMKKKKKKGSGRVFSYGRLRPNQHVTVCETTEAVEGCRKNCPVFCFRTVPMLPSTPSFSYLNTGMCSQSCLRSVWCVLSRRLLLNCHCTADKCLLGLKPSMYLWLMGCNHDWVAPYGGQKRYYGNAAAWSTASRERTWAACNDLVGTGLSNFIKGSCRLVSVCIEIFYLYTHHSAVVLQIFRGVKNDKRVAKRDTHHTLPTEVITWTQTWHQCDAQPGLSGFVPVEMRD